MLTAAKSPRPPSRCTLVPAALSTRLPTSAAADTRASGVSTVTDALVANGSGPRFPGAETSTTSDGTASAASAGSAARMRARAGNSGT